MDDKRILRRLFFDQFLVESHAEADQRIGTGAAAVRNLGEGLTDPPN
ncbi:MULTISPECIES: hypothetical protein [Brevundimonas]|nr:MULTISPECIES: hypothetical protein [Brevundimonas]